MPRQRAILRQTGRNWCKVKITNVIADGSQVEIVAHQRSIRGASPVETLIDTTVIEWTVAESTSRYDANRELEHRCWLDDCWRGDSESAHGSECEHTIDLARRQNFGAFSWRKAELTLVVAAKWPNKDLIVQNTGWHGAFDQNFDLLCQHIS